MNKAFREQQHPSAHGLENRAHYWVKRLETNSSTSAIIWPKGKQAHMGQMGQYNHNMEVYPSRESYAVSFVRILEKTVL